MKKIYSLLVAALLTMPGISYADNDAMLSWDKAPVYVPGQWLTTTVDKIETTSPKPVVIYLHGCGGITKYDHNWATTISNAGFIVIMSDSFARANRLSNCDPSAKRSTRAFPQAHSYRQEEIDYAISQLANSQWADKKNIFLMGHSEGGVAIATRKNHSGIAGEIITGWTCTSPNPRFQGLAAPKELPTLAMATVDDEWFKGTPFEGKCSNFASERRNFKQIDLPGWFHAIHGHADARQAVQEFLTQYKN